MNSSSDARIDTDKLYKITFGLAIFTIAYNIIEGVISIYFGYQDESFTLFGFGVDSFIEAISGLGIAHMVIRIHMKPDTCRDNFERTALRITGSAFYILTAGLVATGIYNLYIGHKPESTFWGVVISIISIAVMLILIYWKRRMGKALNSEAILADAECTRVCVNMSIVLLAASAIYEIVKIPYIDAIGSLALAYYSLREGKECFEKSKNNKHCSCNHE
ncbi:MAG: cation transporter [Ignavibacteriales bacterium]|nr:cation transporter [Ignavibacteriales bacterium]